jgi:uncharacterized protein YbaA (DUF1428 family)
MRAFWARPVVPPCAHAAMRCECDARLLNCYAGSRDLSNADEVHHNPTLRRTVMAYVDGFVVPVKKSKMDAYLEMSRQCGRIWREHGALEYRESVGDDVKPGKLTSFPQSVMLEEDEVVVFSWIVYESRAKRDEVNEKVMKDPRMAELAKPEDMPFDGKRLIYGGFEMILDM